MTKYILLIISILTLNACTFNRNPHKHLPLDGLTIAVMPIKGSYGNYATNQLINTLKRHQFNVISASKISHTAKQLGFQAEHTILPSGDSIYLPQSQKIIAKQLHITAYFIGNTDTIEITNKHFSGAYINLRLIKTDTGAVLWQKSYKPGFWTTAFTAKGHIKCGIQKLVKQFIVYQEPLNK